MTQTPLDRILQTGDRMAFFNLFLSVEVFLLLEGEPKDDAIAPLTFETDDGVFVLAFDKEDRLAAFVGRPAPYAAISGRELTKMLSDQGIGIAINPDVAPSSDVLTSETVDWLAQNLVTHIDEIALKPTEIAAPHVAEKLVQALDLKLASTAGLAETAYLVSARYDKDRHGHILAFVNAQSGAQGALTQAMAEALAFANIEASDLDIAFFDATDPMAARVAKVGLQFTLPAKRFCKSERSAPGMDPANPPKLR